MGGLLSGRNTGLLSDQNEGFTQRTNEIEDEILLEEEAQDEALNESIAESIKELETQNGKVMELLQQAEDRANSHLNKLMKIKVSPSKRLLTPVKEEDSPFVDGLFQLTSEKEEIVVRDYDIQEKSPAEL